MLVLAAPQVFTLAAQDAPPDLRTLKSGLRRDLLAAALPEQKSHREDLLALEKKYAAAQDFAGAIRARDERIKVEQEIASMEKELAGLNSRPGGPTRTRAPERIELKLSEAALSGLKMDPKDSCLIGWNVAGASATWKLPGLPPGGYEVSLNHAGSPVTAMVRESFYSLSSELKPAVDKPVEQRLGTLRVRDGSGSITLSMIPPEKCATLRVYSLVLVPASR